MEPMQPSSQTPNFNPGLNYLSPSEPPRSEKKSKNLKRLASITGIILAGIAVFVIFVSIILNNLPNSVPREVSRTVMIYMVGSDLESKNGLASNELDALAKLNNLTENRINVVMIAGGSEQWNNDYISNDETSIFELTTNEFKKVKTQSLRDMGESAVLSDFLNFVTENYKSDKYDLIFWNHGGAIQGSEYDELFKNDNLSLMEMREAFNNSKFNKKNKLETVIFSTCLNGTLEIANIYKDYADFLVASEEVSVSYAGASDFAFLENISPEDNGGSFGQKFVENYQKKMQGLRKLYKAHAQQYSTYSTYSVVDLSRIDDVNNALDDYFSGIDVLDNYGDIARIRANLYQYANNSSGGKVPDYDTVDLYNLVTELSGYSSKSKDGIISALEHAILYNYATDSKSHGLSIYFPFNGGRSVRSKYVNSYSEIAPASSYTNFIADFFNTQIANGGTKTIDLSKNLGSASNVTSMNADVMIELTDEQVTNFATADYRIIRNDPEYPGYYEVILRGQEYELEGNMLGAHVRGHQLVVYDGESESRYPITLFETEVTDEYVNYVIPVVLVKRQNATSSDGDRSVLADATITNDRVTGTIGISSVRLRDRLDNDGEEENIATSAVVNLDDYEYIYFAIPSMNIMNEDMTYNEDSKLNETSAGEVIVVKTESLGFELKESFDDGYDYYCAFEVIDIYNNHTFSKFIKFK